MLAYLRVAGMPSTTIVDGAVQLGQGRAPSGAAWPAVTCCPGLVTSAVFGWRGTYAFECGLEHRGARITTSLAAKKDNLPWREFSRNLVHHMPDGLDWNGLRCITLST
jgi:hypothetical protein